MQESEIFTEFEEQPSRKVGRPAAEIDMEQLKILSRLQCSDAEIAAVLGISVRTLMYKKAANPEIGEIIQQGKAYGIASLKREQFRKALAGDAALQIWLGKVYANQREPVQRLQVQQVKPIAEWSDDELNAALELEAGRSSETTVGGAGQAEAAPGISRNAPQEFS